MASPITPWLETSDAFTCVDRERVFKAEAFGIWGQSAV